MKLYEYLSQHREPCPNWLVNINGKNGFDHQAFFSSRVVYYPGYGSDGQAVKLFGSSHSAHCFVYADSLTPKEQVLASLDNPEKNYNGSFRGYHSLARVDLTLEQIVPKGWIQHAKPPTSNFAKPHIQPFGFLEVLERNTELTDEYGAQRLAILFLGADGHATYDALFCQRNNRPAPYAVLLQDHGFGGNYSNFGAGGVMEQISQATNVLPAWLIVGPHTNAWKGYQQVDGVESDSGGMHRNKRSLYRPM
jgi:hypothetical protein